MAARGARVRKWVDRINVPLATGAVIAQNDQIGAVPGSFTCNRMGLVTGMKSIGFAMASVNQTTGDTSVQIELPAPVMLEYYANATAGGAIVLATEFMTLAYFLDEGTVTKSVSNGLSAGALITYGAAGMVLDVSSTDGVGVLPITMATALAAAVVT